MKVSIDSKFKAPYAIINDPNNGKDNFIKNDRRRLKDISPSQSRSFTNANKSFKTRCDQQQKAGEKSKSR